MLKLLYSFCFNKFHEGRKLLGTLGVAALFAKLQTSCRLAVKAPVLDEGGAGSQVVIAVVRVDHSNVVRPLSPGFWQLFASAALAAELWSPDVPASHSTAVDQLRAVGELVVAVVDRFVVRPLPVFFSCRTFDPSSLNPDCKTHTDQF